MIQFVVGLVVRVIGGRLLATSPRLRADRGRLVASTSWKGVLWTLGLRLRTVVVDPRLRMVRIVSRYAWFFTAVRRIPFDRVARVIYDYRELNPASHLPLSVYQELDLFTVSLVLTSGETVELCRFFGLGDWVNEAFPWDWIFLDDQIAAELARGKQEDESRAYAVMVSCLIGVPLERA